MYCSANINKALYCLLFVFCFTRLFSQKYTLRQLDTLLIRKNEELRTKISNKDLILWNENLVKISIENNYPKGEAWGYANIANRLWLIGDFKKSLDYLNKAVEKSKNINDDFLEGKINQEFAQVYSAMKLSKLALDYNLKAMKYALKLKKDNQDCRFFLRYVYSTRASYLAEPYQADSSLIYLKKAVRIEANPLDVAHIARYYIWDNKNMDSANYYFKKSFILLEFKKFKHNKYQRAVVLHNYGEFLETQNKNSEAIDTCKASLRLAKEVDRPKLILNNFQLLADLYKKIHELDLENEYLNKATSLKDSLDNNQNKAVILAIDSMEKKELDEKRKTQNNALLYGSISVIVIFLLCTYFYLQIKKKKAKLIQSNEIIIQKEEETIDLKRKLSENHETIIQLARDNSIGFLAKFQEAYPEVCQKLQMVNAKLTKSDLSFCAMIWLGFSSKEIAQCTSMEHRSVQTKKYRIRKKLNIDTETDLYYFIRSISQF
ncbi:MULTISPECIES: transcriptional regulator [unclassified Chryseobacterium]|uniref:transcriptional regulator n=1 Tax=unclassified Chryseobacterium TaxID=2593645 RepID=UPI001AE8AAC3|nr:MULTISPECIES: hypothetical protein [unclassified Chryseobacterium]MBP1164477.1 tetratricopeptide (TPR) repeat protein/DNA-binding CsgD family transcriptional regulator [Chryseobacterium sp. PvR013]MDR4890632.1 hypothetical protein [Chryseobacterium sp. CFS7]